MNNRFKRWCNGYVYARIEGDNKERFINLCSNNKLHIYGLEKYDNYFDFCMNIEEYKNTKRIIRKVHTVPRIYKKVGLPFFFEKCRKRSSFVVGLMLGIFIIYIFSLFIWSIEIDGENYYTDYELMKFLEKRHIRQGMLVKDVVCSDIEEAIRNKYTDIGWVSAQIKGTRLIISIKENVKFDKKGNETRPRHIVAPVDGVIKSIIVKDGEPQVGNGDSVTRGQVLVKGIMNIEDDSKTVIRKHAIASEANIVIEYSKEYYERIDRNYNKRIYADKTRKTYDFIFKKKNYISLFTNNFTLNSIKKIDNFDVIVNNYNVSLGKDYYLPIEIVETDYREYKSIKERYTDDELRSIASSRFDRYKNELNRENVTMINSSIDYYVNDKMLIGKGYVILRDSKMKYIPIDKSELQIEGDVADGNS